MKTEKIKEATENPEPVAGEKSAVADMPDGSAAEPDASTGVPDGVGTEKAPAEAGAESVAATSATLAVLIAEAEERGYLRGRNEAAEELMRKPSLLRSSGEPRADPAGQPTDDTMILRHLRKSVWDR